jgi:hypothetical protein
VLELESGLFVAPLPSVGPAGSGAEIEVGAALGAETPGEWSIALVGGGVGTSSLSFRVTPASPVAPVGAGTAIAILPGGLRISDLEGSLDVEGVSLSVLADFEEPVTGDPIQRVRVLLVETISGVVSDGVDHATSPGHAGGGSVYRSNEVTVETAGVCTGFPSGGGFPSSPNCSALERFQFDLVNDVVNVEVGGADLAEILAYPGAAVAVNAAADCEVATELGAVPGPLPGGESSVTVSFPPQAADSFGFTLCVFTEPVTDETLALEVDVSVAFSSIYLKDSPPSVFDFELWPRCFGDLSGDLIVNNTDAFLFRACFPCAGPGCDVRCDADYDGNVNNTDALEFRRNFGQDCADLWP